MSTSNMVNTNWISWHDSNDKKSLCVHNIWHNSVLAGDINFILGDQRDDQPKLKDIKWLPWQSRLP